MTTTYAICSLRQQKQVNKFYKRHKANVSCNQQDKVFCALNDQQEITGAVLIRKVTESDVFLLRSLYVTLDYRNQGIARRLCELALHNHEQKCITLCESNLLPFYQSLGFIPSDMNIDSVAVQRQIKKGLILLIRLS